MSKEVVCDGQKIINCSQFDLSVDIRYLNCNHSKGKCLLNFEVNIKLSGPVCKGVGFLNENVAASRRVGYLVLTED